MICRRSASRSDDDTVYITDHHVRAVGRTCMTPILKEQTVLPSLELNDGPPRKRVQVKGGLKFHCSVSPILISILCVLNTYQDYECSSCRTVPHIRYRSDSAMIVALPCTLIRRLVNRGEVIQRRANCRNFSSLCCHWKWQKYLRLL